MPDNAGTRYGIAEWYGQQFTSLDAEQRKTYAEHALGESEAEHPICPFQPDQPHCSKKGGVCSMQRYAEGGNGRLGESVGVIVYAHSEAFLSVHHLRQATDAYDLADAACRSYAWWWCYDRKFDVASLREIASTGWSLNRPSTL